MDYAQRLAHLQEREQRINSRIKDLEGILSLENPGKVRCEHKFVVNCLGEAAIGEHGDILPNMRRTDPNRHSQRKSFTLCSPCARYVYDEKGIGSWGSRPYFKMLLTTCQGELRALQADSKQLQTEAQLEEGNRSFLSEFLDQPRGERYDHGDNARATSTLEQVARATKTKTQKKRERRANGAAPKTKPTSAEETVH